MYSSILEAEGQVWEACQKAYTGCHQQTNNPTSTTYLQCHKNIQFSVKIPLNYSIGEKETPDFKLVLLGDRWKHVFTVPNVSKY